ncbi:MAG: glycosyltransferase family 2 protein [Phycisphaeraceae bacterium]|nr:glycosyltransferase family 2 protein [Phycisphaeraceae bacterium]
MLEQPEISIVIPALNEEDNIDLLVEQVKSAIADQGISLEMIVVNDGSTDQTLAKLQAVAKTHPWVKALHRDKAQGQSAAMFAGIQFATGKYIAMLDADLQNDPADIPNMYKEMCKGNVDLVQGDRSQNRNDNCIRKMSSWVGRTARKLILKDAVRDTGCSSRLIKASFAKKLPLQFKGMHRFIPIYSQMLGARIVQVSVNHRQRHAGVAKYGVMNRAFVGLVDCFAMRWMLRRHRDVTAIDATDGHGENK